MNATNSRRLVATKLYGYNWWPAQGRSDHPYEIVPGALSEVGTTLVLLQNQLVPLPARSWFITRFSTAGQKNGYRQSCARCGTARTVIPCLQVRPADLDGIHARAHRRALIGPAEFRDCVNAVAASAADGVMTYHWSDVLAEEAASGGDYSAALSEFAVVHCAG